jgi:hypothetical protein
MRRTQLFWGVILVLVGMLLFVNETGFILPNGMTLMEVLWPVILILCGIWVLLGVFFHGNVQVQNASIELQEAKAVDLKIDHGAGELKIHSGANPNEIARGSFMGGLEQKAKRNGDKLEVRMRPVNGIFDFPFFGPRTQLDWDVALNAFVPLSLKLNLGANKSDLDLRDMNITRLDLDTAASDTKLTLPSRGRFIADLDIGAASLEVIVPESLSARIRASVGAVELRIDQSRFSQNGSYYQSPDFESSANTVDMTVDAGAASIKIN